MKTCISCGEDRNPDDARFCAGCGIPLVTEATGASEPPAPDEPANFDVTASEPDAGPSSGPDPALDLGPHPPDTGMVAVYHEPDWAAPPDPALAGGTEIEPSREARCWAVAAHATALIGGFMGGLPAFLGPLVVWLIRKDDDAWSAGHGRDALNFNLSVLCYGFALGILAIVTLGIGLLIAIPGWIFLALAWFALTIVGTIKAADDKVFKYPLTIRFVKK
jgi:uncharacterized Tic20 family protein